MYVISPDIFDSQEGGIKMAGRGGMTPLSTEVTLDIRAQRFNVSLFTTEVANYTIVMLLIGSLI